MISIIASLFAPLFRSSKKPPAPVRPAGPRHCPPRYYGYHGGWADITICPDCKAHALYEDRHPVDPCPDCGGELKEAVGKWDSSAGLWQVKERRNG